MPPIFAKVVDYVRLLLDYSRQAQKNQREIEELRRQNNDLTDVLHVVYDELQQLRDEVRHGRELDARDRDNLLLRLQNEQLRFERNIERRLPPARSSDEA